MISHRRVLRGIWAVFCAAFSALLGGAATIALVDFLTAPNFDAFLRYGMATLALLSLVLCVYLFGLQLFHLTRIFMRQPLPRFWHAGLEAGLWLIAAALLVYPVFTLLGQDSVI